MDEPQKKVAGIFFPYAMREIARVRDNNVRFVHYTSADAALKILRSERLFLRNSSLMNDFSEVLHGLACLKKAYAGPQGDRLKQALRQVQSDLPEILESNFDGQVGDLLSETYLASVSEHGDGHEEKFGRLSMWRAYAPRDGIAFVLNNTPFVSESSALGAFTSPVAYLMPDEFLPTFEEVVIQIERNVEWLKHLGGQVVHDMLQSAFRVAALSTKHPSFREEREWRIIYTPRLLAQAGLLKQDQADRVPTDILPLAGVPQRVYAIPFKDHPDDGLVGVTLPDLLDRILIGPTRDGYVIAQAFIDELTRLQVPAPESKVIVTGVPLRV